MSERVTVGLPDGTLEAIEAWRWAGQTPEDFVREACLVWLELRRITVRNALFPTWLHRASDNPTSPDG